MNDILDEYSSIKPATQETADEATAKGISVVAYNPHQYKDCRPLLRMGYWPIVDVTPYYIYLYATHTDEELEELVEVDIRLVEDIDRIISTVEWEFSPIGIIRDNAIANADGLRLRFMAPDLVYKSGRPRTDMSTFRNANSNVVKKDEIKQGVWREWKIVPITRYAAGMSRSLFYDDSKDARQWCGTFYYYEEESTTYLAYKKELRSFNKTTATEDLLDMLPNSPLAVEARKILRRLDRYHPEVRRHISGELPRDLRYTTASGISYYDGGVIYAAEDKLDQILCKLAAEAGYDIVILEALAGSFQVVAEVLDVRSRHDSFLSLLYTY